MNITTGLYVILMEKQICVISESSVGTEAVPIGESEQKQNIVKIIINLTRI